MDWAARFKKNQEEAEREWENIKKSGGTIVVQPRSILKDKANPPVFSETVSIFLHRADFASAVAQVIAICAAIDLEMKRVAVSLHGTNAISVLQVAFKALSYENKVREYTRMSAEALGKPEVGQEISECFKASKEIYDIRNKFAHGIWGVCPELPDAVLLTSIDERLSGQAAFSQLLGFQDDDATAQKLIKVATGEGGSNLTESDASALFEVIAGMQNSPAKIQAFQETFENPRGVYAADAEVWFASDFSNAIDAANLAHKVTTVRLQNISRQLHGL